MCSFLYTLLQSKKRIKLHMHSIWKMEHIIWKMEHSLPNLFLNHPTDIWLVCEKVYVFNVNSLLSLVISIHLWNHHRYQVYKHIHHLPKFPLTYDYYYYFLCAGGGGGGEEDKNYEQNPNPLTVPSTWNKTIMFILQLICKPRYFQGQLKIYFSRKFWFSGWNSPFIILFPGGASGKEPVCQCRRHMRQGFDPWVGKIPWRRAWQPTPVFLPGESHGQRSLVGYSPQGCKKSDTTEASQHTCTVTKTSHTQART